MVLEQLCRLAGVSGNEGAVRDYILEKARLLADEVKVDRMGNVLCTLKGTKDAPGPVLLTANMDEVGMIVMGVTQEGLIAYDQVGQLDPRVMVSKQVVVGEKQLPGVIGAKAIHLQSPKDRVQLLSHSQMFVDMGCKDKESAEKLVSPGDTISFAPCWQEFGQNHIMGKALDGRAGCYNLIRLMEERYPVSVTCAFTVQRELYHRGAQVTAQQMEPLCALTLDSAPAFDLGMTPPHQQQCRVGQGVVISLMDKGMIAPADLSRRLTGLAGEKNIPWQGGVTAQDTGDSATLHQAKGPVKTCRLSIPCRGVRSPLAVMHKADIEAQYNLVRSFLLEGAKF